MTPLQNMLSELRRVLDEHTPDVSITDLAVNYSNDALLGVIERARAVHRFRGLLEEMAEPGAASALVQLPAVGGMSQNPPAALFDPGSPG